MLMTSEGRHQTGPALSSAAYGCEVAACNRTALSRYYDTAVQLITRRLLELFRIEHDAERRVT